MKGSKIESQSTRYATDKRYLFLARGFITMLVMNKSMSIWGFIFLSCFSPFGRGVIRVSDDKQTQTRESV